MGGGGWGHTVIKESGPVPEGACVANSRDGPFSAVLKSNTIGGSAWRHLDGTRKRLRLPWTDRFIRGDGHRQLWLSTGSCLLLSFSLSLALSLSRCVCVCVCVCRMRLCWTPLRFPVHQQAYPPFGIRDAAVVCVCVRARPVLFTMEPSDGCLPPTWAVLVHT